jgi:hypothetical protein
MRRSAAGRPQLWLQVGIEGDQLVPAAADDLRYCALRAKACLRAVGQAKWLCRSDMAQWAWPPAFQCFAATALANQQSCRAAYLGKTAAFKAALALLYATHFALALPVFPGSSVVEQPAVNRLVAGSNPARGAK